jgi:hypothetical protein
VQRKSKKVELLLYLIDLGLTTHNETSGQSRKLVQKDLLFTIWDVFSSAQAIVYPVQKHQGTGILCGGERCMVQRRILCGKALEHPCF